MTALLGKLKTPCNIQWTLLYNLKPVLCAWNVPKKRKASALKMSDATFEKYEFGKQKKYNILEMETFDPQPERSRSSYKFTTLSYWKE